MAIVQGRTEIREADAPIVGINDQGYLLVQIYRNSINCDIQIFYRLNV